MRINSILAFTIFWKDSKSMTEKSTIERLITNRVAGCSCQAFIFVLGVYDKHAFWAIRGSWLKYLEWTMEINCHIASPVYSSYVGRNSDDPLGVPPPPTLPSCELFGSHVMRFEEWLRSSGENPQGCIICGGVVVSKASPSV